MTLIDGDQIVYFLINGQIPPRSLRLLDFQIDDSSELLPEVKMVFENHDSRLERPELAKWLFTGNKIKFNHGYIGDLSESQEFEIQSHKGYRELTVIAYPPSRIKDFPRSRIFKKVKESDVVKLMAQELGLKIDDKKVSDTECVRTSINQANETNMKVIKRIAKELNFEFGIQDNYIIFRPKVFNQQSSYVFTYRGQNVIGDILDFKPEKNIFEIPAAYENVFINPATGKPENVQANNDVTKRDVAGGGNTLITAGMGGNRSQQRLGAGAVRPPKSVIVNRTTVKKIRDKTGQTKYKPMRAPTKRRRKKLERCLADDQFKKSEDLIFSAKAEVLGQPRLKARIMITLAGLGSWYDGLWYVDRVVTKAGRSGYKSKLYLIRNSTGKIQQANAERARAAKVHSNSAPRRRVPGTAKGQGRGVHSPKTLRKKVQTR